MILHRVTDWDNAYANSDNIAGGDRWPELWAKPARAYREAAGRAGHAQLGLRYGTRERNRFDLFMPDAAPRGLVVFVHGGYWQRFDERFWSHLAAGPIGHGYAVAMPTYTLCPEVRIGDIVLEVAAAITAAAALVPGLIHLTGHSAGGHLVSRMIADNTPLPPEVVARVGNTVSISGVHDLRPLLQTHINDALRLDADEARRESPAMLEPRSATRLFCWVGAAERGEFIRQSQLLANIWTGLGAETGFYAEPDRHHFDVLDGLADPEHPLTRTLLSIR